MFKSHKCRILENAMEDRLLTDNCSLSFVAGVVGSMPCCFRSRASKAAGFISVVDDVVVEMLI